MEGSGTLEKSQEFSETFFFMPKEALSGFWNHPEELRKLWNIPEYMVLVYFSIWYHSYFLIILELSKRVYMRVYFHKGIFGVISPFKKSKPFVLEIIYV